MSWNTYWRLAENFPANDLKLHFTCLVKHSDGKQCFERKTSSNAISEVDRKTVGLSRNVFNMVVKIAL